MFLLECVSLLVSLLPVCYVPAYLSGCCLCVVMGLSVLSISVLFACICVLVGLCVAVYSCVTVPVCVCLATRCLSC